MILVYAFALFYLLASVVKVYEAVDDRKTRRLARAKQVSVKRIQVSAKRIQHQAEASKPQPPSLPLPPAVPAWLISHDEALSLLSPSLRAKFTEKKKGTAAKRSLTTITLSPSEARTLTSTERSEVQHREAFKGFLLDD